MKSYQMKSGMNKETIKSPGSKGTVLIMGDSTLNGVQEVLLGPRFKVRAHPGAIEGLLSSCRTLIREETHICYNHGWYKRFNNEIIRVNTG